MQSEDRARAIYFQTGLVRRALIGAYFPLLALRVVTDVELTPLQLVLLGTAMEVAILFAEVPTGVVADLYSRRWSVIIAFLIGGPSIVVTAFAEPFWALVLAQAAFGVAITFESGAETAWVTDELGSSEDAEPLILRRAQWEMFATIFGIGAFAGIAVIFTLTTALGVLGVLHLCWGISLIVRMPENNFAPIGHSGWSGFASLLRRGWQLSMTANVLRVLVLAVFIMGLAKEAIDRLDVQRLVDVGLPEDINEAVVIGVIVAVRSLFAAAVVFVARQRASGQRVVLSTATMLVAMAISVAVLAHMELLLIAAAALIVRDGFSRAIEPVVTTWANAFASSEARATVHSFIGQAEAFGEILGGVALGTVAEVFTVPTAMTISAILFLIAGGVALTGSARYREAAQFTG